MRRLVVRDEIAGMRNDVAEQIASAMQRIRMTARSTRSTTQFAAALCRAPPRHAWATPPIPHGPLAGLATHALRLTRFGDAKFDVTDPKRRSKH